MAKLIFTGQQVDDAIKKVKEGYADVSKVTATAADVRLGKRIVDKNKVEQEGKLTDGEIIPQVTIKSSSYISNSETNYPITFNPSYKVEKSGLVSEGKIGVQETKYIQTEEKVVEPTGTTQIVKPSNGKLLSKVHVKPTPEAQDWPMENFPCPYFYFYINKTTSSSSSVICRFQKDTLCSNISLKAAESLSEARVYLVPVTTSSTSTSYFWGTVNMIDSVSHRLRDDIIELKTGESFTSLSSNFAPAGVLTFTNNRKLEFKFTEDFDGMSVYATNENYNYSTMALFLYDGQTHYAVICDAEKWISGTQKVGIKTTSTTKHYTNRGLPNKPMIADGINSYNFEACGALISNYAPVYFSWNYIDEKTSYEMASMTLGGGTKYYIPKETRKLNEPIAKIEGTDLIWTAVENATSYGIKIQKNGSTSATNKTTTELSYSLTSIYSSPGLYVVSVRAIGKNIASNWFTINWNYIVELDTPIIELLDTSLSWDYVENSSSYAIYDNGVLWKTTDTEIIDLNKFSLSEGTHKFQVQAISTTDGYADSKLSDSITIVIEKLDAPTITRDEQVILWDEIENAQKYKIYKDTEFISTTKETAFDLSNIDFEAGTYSMSIKATAPLNSDSNFSNSISITMIEAPTLTFSSEGVLSWNNIANATSYNLWIDNELVYSGNLTSHDMTEYVESIQDMHEYRVQAIGNNGLFSSKSTFEIKGDGHSFDTAVAITFGSDGLTIEDEQIDDTNYPIRYYKLKVLESDDYYMYTESSYDTYGELYDSKQNQLDYNDDGGSDSNCCINCSLEVGEVYYLAIRQYSKKTCTFSLHIDTTGPETDDGPFRPEIS